MDKKQKQKLKKFINELKQIRGRHTELVSVYVPAGYELHKIIQHLQQEQHTASNIKDAKTRKNVIDSLERAIVHLRLYKRTPENGLAIFAGNASDKENKTDIKVWSIEPPEPLNTRMYRCDQTFVLDILENMMDVKEFYALLVVDRREGDIGLLKGTSITKIVGFKSDVPGKTTKGGQCLHPKTFVELKGNKLVNIEVLKVGDKVKSYAFKEKKFIFSEVLDKWTRSKNEIFIIEAGENKVECSKDHIFFLANGETKAAEELKEKDVLLDNKVKSIEIENIKKMNKEVSMIDISIKNQNFIANCIIVHNSQQRYAGIREAAAKDFFKKVGGAFNKEFLEMKNLKGILIGGPGPTKQTFIDGPYLNNELKRKIISVQDLGYTGEFGLNELVDKSQEVLARESIIEEKKILNRFFETLAKEPEKIAYGKKETEKAIDMGAVDLLLLSDDLDDDYIEELDNKAEKTGSKVEIISTETKEGIQLKELGGVAAILRYQIS